MFVYDVILICNINQMELMSNLYLNQILYFTYFVVELLVQEDLIFLLILLYFMLNLEIFDVLIY